MDEGSRQGSGPSSEVAIEREDKEVEESGTSPYTCIHMQLPSVYIHCTCSVDTMYIEDI